MSAITTVPIGAPQVNPQIQHRFATRKKINVIAIVCDCGAIFHGKGVGKAKMCSRCGAYVITNKDARYRETHGYQGTDQLIFNRYQKREPKVLEKPEKPMTDTIKPSDFVPTVQPEPM
jgi:hypothetical protein